jgi:hypothetical protein
MSRSLIAGPTCDCVTCLVHKLMASCIARGFTGRQPVTRARPRVMPSLPRNPSKRSRRTRDDIFLSPVQSLYVVGLKLPLRTHLARRTHVRPVEEPIASLVLLVSPVIPCSLASSLVLSLAICCSVSHLFGPCFVPGRRGLATIGHRIALGPPGYPLYPRVSELEKCLDNPYSVELIRGTDTPNHS